MIVLGGCFLEIFIILILICVVWLCLGIWRLRKMFGGRIGVWDVMWLELKCFFFVWMFDVIRFFFMGVGCVEVWLVWEL